MVCELILSNAVKKGGFLSSVKVVMNLDSNVKLSFQLNESK